MQSERLQSFLELINRLVQNSFQSYGRDGNFPNPTSTEREVGYKLQQATLAFAAAYVDSSKSIEQVKTHADEVYALISLGQTLTVLTDKEADNLLHIMNEIVEER